MRLDLPLVILFSPMASVKPPAFRSICAISLEVDSAARQPGPALKTLTASQLHGDGLYAFTAINAPLGLTERIHHDWVHNGKVVDSIELDISGGREPGYRAWTHKTNFPDVPNGRWEVRVVTAGGQRIGTLRFRIAADASPPAPGQA